MKNFAKIKLLILLFLCCGIMRTIKAQEINYNNEIIVFFDALTKFDKYYDKESGWQKEFTKNEIMEISSKYYKAISKNPIEFNLYFDEVHKLWEENGSIIEDINHYSKRPGLKLGRLKRKIQEYTSPIFSELLGIPYFLKIKVKRFERTKYHSEDAGTFGQTNMFAEIKDVLKGAHYFNINDTIKISYLDFWFTDSRNESRFRENRLYFVLLRPWRIESRDDYYFSINGVNDQSNGVYAITNDSIHTSRNYWGTENKVKWIEFKKYVLENYILN